MALPALVEEYKIGPHDWPSIIRVILTALNEGPLFRLTNPQNPIHALHSKK